MEGARGLYLDVALPDAKHEALRQMRTDGDQQGKAQQPRERLEMLSEAKKRKRHRAYYYL